MKAVAIITALCLIGVIWLLIKGHRDAKEIEDDNTGLTQDEIDAFMARAKDRHLSKLIDDWGRKKFYKEVSEMPDKKKASQRIIDRSERTPDLCCGKYEDPQPGEMTTNDINLDFFNEAGR